jgi:hypothetical protein
MQELLCSILSWLSPNDLTAVRMLSQYIHDVSCDDTVNKMLVEMCQAELDEVQRHFSRSVKRFFVYLLSLCF